MAKAISLHVLIRYFDNELGTQRLPGKIFSAAPAAFAPWHAMFVTVGIVFLPGFPGVVRQRILAVGAKECEELPPLFLCKAGADANVLERSSVVIQSQQKGANGVVLALLIPAKAGDDAVAIALMLQLEHDPLVRFVGAFHRLDHDSIEARTFKALKPVGGDGSFCSCRCQVKWWCCVGEHFFQTFATLMEWSQAQVFGPFAQHIKQHDGRGSLVCEQVDPRGGRVDAKLQCIEIERAISRDDEFAIDDAAGWELLQQRWKHLWEIAIQRFLLATLDQDFLVIAKYQHSESIPLGLENPVAAGWNFFHTLGQHWQDGWVHWKVHEMILI